MNLKTFLTHLFKENTPDEEERIDGSQESRVTFPQDSQHIGSEKVRADAGAAAPSGGTNQEDDEDREDEDDLLSVSGFDDQPDSSTRGPRRVFSRILSFIFPSPSDEEEIQSYIPHYRILPIFSGIAIPFCILLDIPGLTADWYIRTDGSTIIASKPNPPLLDIGIGLSLLCAVLANLCLVVRFLERRIKMMTILCIVFLSIHDIINIAALTTFGASKGDYTFSQAFWMTLCSTIVSMFTNVTLIIDLVRTSDFKRSGSGLTRKQRSLVIIIIGQFCYIALGALVNSLLLGLTFINGLYFTVVTIETIGFGDIVPNSTSSRVFIAFYATLGIINLAFVVGYVRETVLEGLDFGYRRRLLEIKERRRTARTRRRVERRWRHAIIWRLRGRREPVWIPKNANGHKSPWSILKSCLRRLEWGIRSTTRRSTHQSHRRPGMQLNLWALPPCQLEAAALEAGCTLDALLPEDFYDLYDQEPCRHRESVKHHALPSWFVVHPIYRRDAQAPQPLTHRRLGAMATIITKVAFSIYDSSGNPLESEHGVRDASAGSVPEVAQDSAGSLQANSTDDGGDYREDVEDTEKRAYFTRSGLSWVWFLLFWMGGAAIFKATEDWTYGVAIYFCFIAFTTIGYGDLVPTTPAGRSIFVVWALIGVATMTIFISVISEAYTSRYKGILGRNSFKRVIRQYRERNKAELSVHVQRIGTSSDVKFVRYDTIEPEEIDAIQSSTQSPVSPTFLDGATLAVASTSKSDSEVQDAQKSLEKLPKQILVETRSIQRYMQLIGDFDGHSAEVERFIDGSVCRLIDDVMSGRKLNECTKRDIIRDGESRQTLMLLGIERSLKELVSISEQAIAAIQERDRIIATLEREKEQEEAEIAS